MFDRFLRFAEAKRALSQGQLETALQLAGNPLLADDRRAAEIRERALRGLLARAARRRDAGMWEDALADVDRVLAAAPDFAGARTLHSELGACADQAAAGARAAASMLRDARSLAANGELEAAKARIQAVSAVDAPAEREAVARLIEARAHAAVDLLAQSRQALAAGETERARELLVRARAQHRGLAGSDEVAAQVAGRLAAELEPKLRALADGGRVERALELLSAQRAALPELDRVPAIQRFVGDIAGIGDRGLRQLLESGHVEQAVDSFHELAPRLAENGLGPDVRLAMAQLSRALELRDRGDFAGAAGCVGRAAEQLRLKALRDMAARLATQQESTDAAIGAARELAAAGRLMDARRQLLPILEHWPMHEAARREMDILDRGARDVEQRLMRARALAGEGKLREASVLAVALAVPGPQGEEARLLLEDLRARMDLVAKGVDQVRRALHGRDSCSIAGLRHCLLRLEQLAKVQTDNEEIEGLRCALDAEIEGVKSLDAAAAAARDGDAQRVADLMAGLGALRERMLRADRLDARCLDVADQVAALAEQALAAGRLVQADCWLRALRALANGHPDLEERLSALAVQASQRRALAESAARRGGEALAERDIARAEQRLDEARQAWVDGPGVRRLEAELLKLRRQEAALSEVEQLTVQRDFGAAHRNLAGLPPTPAVLRTRIFDIKQSLARAQGLDGGFLLRVDEGGEFLVLRGESIIIGNVRDGQADLAVLANISGRHARIVRSMSFHGGMQDRIVAERGSLVVDGREVSEHRLRDGDRVRLGSVLDLVYRLPSARSLTASITLGSGFQVAGTDKVLLMKDRGRDGRILIGPVQDAHVRTPHPQPVVELFATRDGQVRVRCEGEGEVNGKPFSGEHPVEAGALVRCGEVCFALQPLPGAPGAWL